MDFMTIDPDLQQLIYEKNVFSIFYQFILSKVCDDK